MKRWEKKVDLVWSSRPLREDLRWVEKAELEARGHEDLHLPRHDPWAHQARGGLRGQCRNI